MAVLAPPQRKKIWGCYALKPLLTPVSLLTFPIGHSPKHWGEEDCQQGRPPPSVPESNLLPRGSRCFSPLPSISLPSLPHFCLLKIQIWGLGSAVGSPSWVRGGAPPANAFLRILGLSERISWQHFQSFMFTANDCALLISQVKNPQFNSPDFSRNLLASTCQWSGCS